MRSTNPGLNGRCQKIVDVRKQKCPGAPPLESGKLAEKASADWGSSQSGGSPSFLDLLTGRPVGHALIVDNSNPFIIR